MIRGGEEPTLDGPYMLVDDVGDEVNLPAECGNRCVYSRPCDTMLYCMKPSPMSKAQCLDNIHYAFGYASGYFGESGTLKKVENMSGYESGLVDSGFISGHGSGVFDSGYMSGYGDELFGIECTGSNFGSGFISGYNSGNGYISGYDSGMSASGYGSGSSSSIGSSSGSGSSP